MIGLIGKKLGQTRVYDDVGNAVSVTVVQAGPNHVVQVKISDGSDKYDAVQLGFDDQKEHRLNKPTQGHLKKHNAAPVKCLREFRDFSLEVKPGDTLGPDIFEVGDYVDAIGTTKGRGFQGVVKRWNFGGGPRSHGQKGWFRRPGAMAAGSTPGWVDKGKKMPGQMGGRQRTVQNLKIIQVRQDDNLLLVSGAIPGAVGDYVILREAKKRPKAAK